MYFLCFVIKSQTNPMNPESCDCNKKSNTIITQTHGFISYESILPRITGLEIVKVF